MSFPSVIANIARRVAAILVIFAAGLGGTAQAETTSPLDACFNFLDAQDYRRAQASAEALVKRKPQDRSAQLCLGRALLAQSDFKRALVAFKVVESLSRSKVELGVAYNFLASVYSDLEETDAALSYSQRALLLMRELGHHKGEATELNNLGQLYQKKGDVGRAIETYEESLRLTETEADKAATWSNLGLLYSQQGDWSKATSMLQKALDAARRAGNAHQVAVFESIFAVVQIRNGDLEAAEGNLKEALAGFQKLGVKDMEKATLDALKALEVAKLNAKKRS